jgi:hypothetical protein
LDREAIISIALLVILVLIALNYFPAECNIGDDDKPIKRRMNTEPGPILQMENESIEHGAVEPERPNKKKDDEDPDGRRPVPPVPSPEFP